MSSPELFEPRILRDTSTAIVINNHLGASVRLQSGAIGATGRDAQTIAHHTGRYVIAHNRIGTGDDAEYKKAYVYDPRTDTGELAREWADQVVPLVKACGVKNVHLLGKSVGATPLLAVAKLDILPVSGICAVEPIGFTKMSTWQAKARVAAYTALEACLADEDVADLRLASRGTVRRLIVDIVHNQAGWRSTDALNTVGTIGYHPHLRNIPVHLAFAGISLAGLRSELKSRLNVLHSSRRDLAIAPLSIAFVPGTTHRSFNDVGRYITQYDQLDHITKRAS
jgi:pimeloyl-ACP methyl ester carboxylesterase